MDEGKLRKQQDRGERAKRLLQNELLIEAFDKIQTTIDEAWKNSLSDEDRERYNAYLMHRLLQNLQAELKHIVISGDAARKELLRIKDPSKVSRILKRA